MRKILISLIDIYKITLSPLLEVVLGKGCRFNPTCSEYAKAAIEKHGASQGSLLAIKRVLRCHPFTKSTLDPVPEI